jgi:hypothetical protein
VVELFSEKHSLLTESDPSNHRPHYVQASPRQGLPTRLSSNSIIMRHGTSPNVASSIAGVTQQHQQQQTSATTSTTGTTVIPPTWHHPPSHLNLHVNTNLGPNGELRNSDEQHDSVQYKTSTNRRSPDNPKRTQQDRQQQQQQQQQQAPISPRPPPSPNPAKKRDVNKIYKSSSVTEMIHGKDLVRAGMGHPSRASVSGSELSSSQTSSSTAFTSANVPHFLAPRPETFDNFTPTLSPRTPTSSALHTLTNPFPPSPRRSAQELVSPRNVSSSSSSSASVESGSSSAPLTKDQHVIVIGANTLLFGMTVFGLGFLLGYILQHQRK